MCQRIPPHAGRPLSRRLCRRERVAPRAPRPGAPLRLAGESRGFRRRVYVNKRFILQRCARVAIVVHHNRFETLRVLNSCGLRKEFVSNSRRRFARCARYDTFKPRQERGGGGGRPFAARSCGKLESRCDASRRRANPSAANVNLCFCHLLI